MIRVTALTTQTGDYRNLVESGREQFEAEVRSLLPEVKLGETSDKLTRDELNLLIAHAHRKVLQLQNQLARLQVCQLHGLSYALMLLAQIQVIIELFCVIYSIAFINECDVVPLSLV